MLVLADANRFGIDLDQLSQRILQTTSDADGPPHGHIQLKTPTKTWIAVLAPPSRMDARGLSREMLKDGSTATVEGYASRVKPDEMRAERITIAGKTVELR